MNIKCVKFSLILNLVNDYMSSEHSEFVTILRMQSCHVVCGVLCRTSRVDQSDIDIAPVTHDSRILTVGVKALTDDSVTKTVVESSHPTHVTGQGGTLHHGVLTDVVEHTVVCEVTLMGGRREGGRGEEEGGGGEEGRGGGERRRGKREEEEGEEGRRGEEEEGEEGRGGGGEEGRGGGGKRGGGERRRGGGERRRGKREEWEHRSFLVRCTVQ